MKTYKLTCSTEGCFNSGIEIELATEADVFVCGPCAQPIASVVEKTQDKPAAEK